MKLNKTKIKVMSYSKLGKKKKWLNINIYRDLVYSYRYFGCKITNGGLEVSWI